jgi:uncharacterized protein
MCASIMLNACRQPERQCFTQTQKAAGCLELMNVAWEDAIKRNDVEKVLALLGRGTEVNALDRYGQTALMLAAHDGHREIVEILITHRANLNITAKFGLSALMLAVVADHVEIARLLAKAGADVSLRGTGAAGFAGKTAYDLAIERGMTQLCAELKPTGKKRTAA